MRSPFVSESHRVPVPDRPLRRQQARRRGPCGAPPAAVKRRGEKLRRRRRLRADEHVQGRIAATLALIDYFLAFEASCNRFPGFSYEVQGVYQIAEDGKIRFYTYVVKE